MTNIHGLSRKKGFDLISRILPLFFLIFSFFYLLILLPNSFVKQVQAVTETRYFRSDTQSVNSLTAYILGTTQSSSNLSTVVNTSGTGEGTSYWGIRVWKRNSSGTETEITSGTPVAQVTRTASGSGIQSATWTPPETTLATTDSIVVRVYLRVNTGSWLQGGTAPNYTTEQLGNTLLESLPWTVYYHTQDSRSNTGPPNTRYINITYFWGNSTYNSRIENFIHSSSTTVLTVGSYGTQRATVEPTTTDIPMGGAFTFVRSASSTNVTSITISNTGTISDSDLTELDLYYKQESTCSATMPVDATLFNSTSGTFSSGSSTVTGTMSVTASQVCLYVDLDIGSGATNGETIELQITNPSTQVSVSTGTVSPATAVAISGTTTVAGNQAPSFTAFSNDGPKEPGEDITFSATSTDPNGDTVSLSVCKSTGYTTDTEWNIDHALYTRIDVPLTTSSGSFLDSSGSHFYTVNTGNRTVSQYTLSTPWDITTYSYIGIFDIGSSQDNSPTTISFSTDGTKMYMAGTQNSTVFQYSLSTAWDIATLSYASKSSYIGTQETSPSDLYFNSDGTLMYLGGASDTIFQYSLSTAWDISTASYSTKYYSVTSQTSYLKALTLSQDGTKLHILDSNSDILYQYSLSTAWDISTASYSSRSLSLSHIDTGLLEFFFNGDGNKIILNSTSSTYEYAIPAISCDGGSSDTYCASFLQASNPSCKYTIPIPTIDDTYTNIYPYVFDMFDEPSSSSLQGVASSYEVANATPFLFSVSQNAGAAISLTEGQTKSVAITGTVADYNSCNDLSTVQSYLYRSGIATTTVKEFSFANQDTSVSDLFMSTDGTKMYIIGDTSDTIYQYTLSTAWDINTASYASKSLSVGNEDTVPSGISFKPDGTKMYMLGATNNTVYQYSLPTAWDLSTAYYDSISFNTNLTYAEGITVSPDGTKIYIINTYSSVYGGIYRFSLGTAWDITTSISDSYFNAISFTGASLEGVKFSSDGDSMYIVSAASQAVYEFSLFTEWNVYKANYRAGFSVSSKDTLPKGLSFNSDGTKMYVLGDTSDKVYQYMLYNAWDIYSTTMYGNARDACDSSGEANGNHCYPEITCNVDAGSCTGDTDTTATYTCTANLESYADPTDADTPYSGQYWLSLMKATDDDSAIGSEETKQGVVLNSLIAFSIDSSIFYGNIGAGSSNDPLDVTTTSTPTGNTGLDHEVSGPANMCTDFPTCSGSTIGIANQRYATASLTAFSSGTVLTTSPVSVTMNILKPINATPASKNLWWGIYVPTDADAGTYYGNITVTGIKSNISNWYE